MRPLIEFCVNNLTPEVEKVKEELEQDPDIDVMEYGCLGNCSECYVRPYALVDGDFIAADTGPELLTAIREIIEEQEDMWEQLDRLLDD